MRNLDDQVVLVTGASAGIGAAICRLLVQSGMKVVGCARNVDRIKELANELHNEKGSLFPIKCDVTNDEEVYAMFELIKKTYGGVDICINNAGISYMSSLITGTPEEWRQMLAVNVVSLCLCTKLTIASMKERGVDNGHIINISSKTAHCIPKEPGSHFYSSTKHTVKAITESLRQELRDAKSNIKVSSISPGMVETEIIQRATNDIKLAQKLYSVFAVLKPEDIASTVLHTISSPPHIEINDITVAPLGNPGF